MGRGERKGRREEEGRGREGVENGRRVVRWRRREEWWWLRRRRVGEADFVFLRYRRCFTEL